MRLSVLIVCAAGASGLQFADTLSSGASLVSKAANYALRFSQYMKGSHELPEGSRKWMDTWEDLVHSTHEVRNEHGPHLKQAASLLQKETTRLQNRNVTGNEMIHGLARAIKDHGLEHRLNLLGKTMQNQMKNHSIVEGLYVGIPYWHSFQFSMGIVGFPFSWWPNVFVSSEREASAGFVNDDRAVIKLFSTWDKEVCKKICIQLVWVTHYVITYEWRYVLYAPPFSNVEGGLLLGYGNVDYPEGWGDGPSWTFRHGLLGDVNLQFHQTKLAPMGGDLFGHPFGIMGNIAIPDVVMNPYLKLKEKAAALSKPNSGSAGGKDAKGKSKDDETLDRNAWSVMTGFGFYMAYTFCLPAFAGGDPSGDSI